MFIFYKNGLFLFFLGWECVATRYLWVPVPGGPGWVYQCPFCFHLLQRNPWDWTLQLSGKQGHLSSWEGHAHFVPCVPCPSSSWGWVQPLVVHGLVPAAALVPAHSPQRQQEELELPRTLLWSFGWAVPWGSLRCLLLSMGQDSALFEETEGEAEYEFDLPVLTGVTFKPPLCIIKF